jgi:hypothetical protein
MIADLIHDRGRGPEILGTRITVYNLLPYLLDPTATEAYICQVNELSPEQVAAARAYVLNYPDTVLAEHLKIEERMAAGNPPQVMEQAKLTHASFVKFRDRLAERRRAAAADHISESTSATGQDGSVHLPTFREWLAERDTHGR